jgi:hypothetical protein
MPFICFLQQTASIYLNKRINILSLETKHGILNDVRPEIFNIIKKCVFYWITAYLLQYNVLTSKLPHFVCTVGCALFSEAKAAISIYCTRLWSF